MKDKTTKKATELFLIIKYMAHMKSVRKRKKNRMT